MLSCELSYVDIMGPLLCGGFSVTELPQLLRVSRVRVCVCLDVIVFAFGLPDYTVV